MDRRKTFISGGRVVKTLLALMALVPACILFGQGVDEHPAAAANPGWSIDRSDAPPVVEWFRTNGTETTSERAYDVDTRNGDIYVTGTIINGGNGLDIFLSRYAQNGSCVWFVYWGFAPYSDVGKGVAIGQDGVYVAGWIGGATSSTRAVLLKFAFNGTLLWFRYWGTTNQAYFHDVAVDDSAVYAAGCVEVNAGDALVAKYSFGGVSLQNWTWGYSGLDLAYAVTTYRGDVFISGDVNSPGHTQGQNDMFLARAGFNGTSWEATWGESLNDGAQGITVTPSGLAIMAGFHTHAGYTDQDAILRAYNAVSGAFVWMHNWTTVSSDLAYDVCSDESSIHFTGYTYSPGQSYNAFVSEIDYSGNALWNVTWGGAGDETGHGIAVDGPVIYVGGETSSYGAGGLDALLVKLGPPANVAPAITHQPPVEINFGAQNVNLTWNVTDSTTSLPTYEIFDDGELVGSGPWTPGVNVTFSLNGFDVGTHTVIINASDGLGLSVQDSTVVTVLNVAPELRIPSDIVFLTGSTGHFLTWNILDDSTGTTNYTILVNDAVNGTGSWTDGQPVTVTVDTWAIGIYNVTIIVDDGLGGVAEDTAFVTVQPETAPDGIGIDAMPAVAFLLFGIAVAVGIVARKHK